MKENLIQMRMMSTAFNHGASRRRARRLAVGLSVACMALLVSASAAFAAPEWRITSAHGPQNMAPGGLGQYVIQVYNIGDTDLNTLGDMVVNDTLPAGVTATSFLGTGWSCSGLGVAGGTVSCTQPIPVPQAAGSVTSRGAQWPLKISVTVDPGNSGTLDNSVTVTGGDAPDASATDPTPFSVTPAGFGFVPGSFQADVFDGLFPGGTVVRQAGSHPFEARFGFSTNLTLGHDPDDPSFGDILYTEPEGAIKTLQTHLPAGFIGNPEATPKCPVIKLNEPGPGNTGICPSNTQVGTADLVLSSGKRLYEEDGSGVNVTQDLPVFNMEPPPGTVAAFAFSYIGNPVWIIASVDPKDYSIVATISNTNQIYPPRSTTLTLWGVPGDPAHDALRLNPDAQTFETVLGAPSNAPLRPFLTLPSQCGVDGVTSIAVDSWQHPGEFVEAATDPTQMTGCDDPRLRFDAEISVQPESRKPNVPTALDVELTVPQKDDTASAASDLYSGSTGTGNDQALATPPLRNAKVTLPEGMRVSPSSADGLAACSSVQIALHTNDEPTCPDASKIGTLSIDTPLLPDPLTGTVYLAAQTDNPFGSLLALYLVAKGPGIIIKLPGEVAPDPLTGQLAATFDDNPQVPFTKLHLRFKGGPRAALVTPSTCGVKTTTAQLTSWNASLPAVQTSDSFTISGDGKGGPCTAQGFDPSFIAGTDSPIAGGNAKVVTRFKRADTDEELSKVDVTLPEGVLGRIAKVDLCSNAAADAGTCGDGSRIATVKVGAGPGSNPFFITDGKAFITEGYKGAPFGLSIVVHAKAGPFDLGNVIVRAQVLVDRRTAVLRVVSDPLPTILKGIPLQVRVVDVTVDRPGFTFNPTNCSELRSSATLGSTGGKTATKTSRFQVTDCAALPFKPRLTMRVGRKGHTATGKSTPLVTKLTMPKGRSANLAGVKVTLPGALNALLPVITDSCTQAEFNADNCAKAKAGTATAITPLLKKPLRGGVYFVKDPTKPKGSLPNLVVALRGQVDVDLVGKVIIPNSNLLSTNFDAVPDVPVSKFVLRLSDGKNGPIGVARNLCSKKSRSGRVGIVFTAQNGKVVRRSQQLVVNGCAKKAKGGKAGKR